jgi:multiple sugar transport system permease protein
MSELVATLAPVARKKASSRSRRERLSFYFFLSPWIFGFLVISLIPLLLGLAISFTNYGGFDLTNLKFVGVNNYARAIADPDVPFSLKRTVLFTAISVPAGIVLAFGIAMMLNGQIAGRDVFRTIWYIPAILPIVAACWIWKLFGGTNTGLLNAVISLFRPGTAIRWLDDYATYTLIAFTLWGGAGRSMVIFLAGLQGIPTELKEAASIDGATKLDVFGHIILPLMTPVVFFQLVMHIIGALQTMQPALLLAETPTEGMGAAVNIPRANYMYMIHVYVTTFTNNNYGYGNAMLWLMFALILALTLVVFKSSRYWVYYEVDQEGSAG